MLWQITRKKKLFKVVEISQSFYLKEEKFGTQARMFLENVQKMFKKCCWYRIMLCGTELHSTPTDNSSRSEFHRSGHTPLSPSASFNGNCRLKYNKFCCNTLCTLAAVVVHSRNCVCTKLDFTEQSILQFYLSWSLL